MVKVRIVYDAEYYRAVNHNSLSWWIYLCVTVLLWGFVIAQIAGLVQYRYFWLLLVFAVMFTISQLIQSAFFTTKIRDRNSPDPQAVWSFDENGMICDFSAEGRQYHETFAYSQLASVKEYGRYFCVKLKEPQMNIFMKHCITEGTAEELSIFLRGNVEKYQVKY